MGITGILSNNTPFETGIAVGFLIVFLLFLFGFLAVVIVDWFSEVNEMRREFLDKKIKEEERRRKKKWM